MAAFFFFPWCTPLVTRFNHFGARRREILRLCCLLRFVRLSFNLLLCFCLVILARTFAHISLKAREAALLRERAKSVFFNFSLILANASSFSLIRFSISRGDRIYVSHWRLLLPPASGFIQ